MGANRKREKKKRGMETLLSKRAEKSNLKGDQSRKRGAQKQREGVKKRKQSKPFGFRNRKSLRSTR